MTILWGHMEEGWPINAVTAQPCWPHAHETLHTPLLWGLRAWSRVRAWNRECGVHGKSKKKPRPSPLSLGMLSFRALAVAPNRIFDVLTRRLC